VQRAREVSARMWPKFWRRPGSWRTRSQGGDHPLYRETWGSAKSTFTYASRATTSLFIGTMRGRRRGSAAM